MARSNEPLPSLDALRRRERDLVRRERELREQIQSARRRSYSILRSQSRLDAAFSRGMSSRWYVPQPSASLDGLQDQALGRLEWTADERRRVEGELDRVREQLREAEAREAERKELPEAFLKAIKGVAATGPERARAPARTLLDLYDHAIRGVASSQLTLGRALRDGRLGLPPDLRRARLWLAEAARQGDTIAAQELAALGGPVRRGGKGLSKGT